MKNTWHTTLLLPTLLLLPVTFMPQAAQAQMGTVLPTDVTGPTAGGVRAQGILNNLGINSGFYGQTFSGGVYGSPYVVRGTSAQVITMPAVVPQPYFVQQPAYQRPVRQLFWQY